MSNTQTSDDTQSCRQIEMNAPRPPLLSDVEARAATESNIDLVPGGLWAKMCGKWCYVFIGVIVLGAVAGFWVVLGSK